MKQHTQVAYLVTLILTLATFNIFAGGEIGNGHFVKYSNELWGFKTQHPSDWQYFDLDSTISFIETKDDKVKSYLSVVIEVNNEMHSLNNLLPYLNQKHPDSTWDRIEFAQRDGFYSLFNELNYIYILKEEKIIVSLIWPTSSEPNTKDNIEKILNLFEFK